ncbi:MAG: hypothetical protein JSW06_03720, partial [Thermoplasmatales archaeon]
VTLVVTDNNGIAHSKTITVNVSSEAEKEQKSVIPVDLGIILIGSALILILCFAVFFRDDIKSFASKRYINLFSRWKIRDTRDKIKKIDAQIDKIKKERLTKTDFKLPPMGIEDVYSDKIQMRYDRICKLIDYESVSTSEEKKSFDEFDKLQTGEIVDKLIRMELKPDTPSTESVRDIDLETRVDSLILSGGRKTLYKFDIDSVFSDFVTESIERKIDDIVFTKTRQKIDAL